jgi:hypothetical protein
MDFSIEHNSQELGVWTKKCCLYKATIFSQQSEHGSITFRIIGDFEGVAFNKIGLHWLEKLFNSSTISRTKGKFRLSIPNSHESHLTPKFDEICEHRYYIWYRLICGLKALVRSDGYNQDTERDQPYWQTRLTLRLPFRKNPALSNPILLKNCLWSSRLNAMPFWPDRLILRFDICLRTANPPPPPSILWARVRNGSQKRLQTIWSYKCKLHSLNRYFVWGLEPLRVCIKLTLNAYKNTM